MPTFDNVGLQEPSTVTAVVATVSIARGSTTEQQEIQCLGDPETSNAIARVLNAAPASTTWGLAVRDVDPITTLRVTQSTAADLNVTVAGYVAPSTIVTVSTGSLRVQQSSAADLNVTVAGYVAPSTTMAVSTGSVRVHQSTAADLQATVAPLAGSTWVVRALQSSAADLQVTATVAAPPITVLGGMTAWTSTNAAVRQHGQYVIQGAASTATGSFTTSSNCQHAAVIAAFSDTAAALPPLGWGGVGMLSGIGM